MSRGNDCMKKYFLIDLDKKVLKVEEYPQDDLKVDLRYFKLKDPLELSNFDFKVFDSEKKAMTWLKRFTDILSNLDNKVICKSRELLTVLLKRKYMAQTIMGEKKQTYRSYKKDWQKGQLFNFHDQTFFLTVKLSSIEKNGKFGYCYKFSLLK
jgi:hypothetical protein